VEDISARLILSPQDAVPAKAFTEDVQVERGKGRSKTVSRPIYPVVVKPESDDDLEVLSGEEEDTDFPCNETEYLRGLLTSQSLLYSSPQLQVGFKRTDEQMTLVLCNCGKTELNNIEVSPKDCPAGQNYSGFELTLLSPTSLSPLKTSAQVALTFSMVCHKPFLQPPEVLLVYSTPQQSSVPLRLKLPIGILHFSSPFQDPVIDLEQHWTDLAPFHLSKTFSGLHSFLTSMKDLAALLASDGHLRICSNIDLPWMDSHSLMAIGRILGKEVMLMVNLRSEATGGVISVRAVNIRLREGIATQCARLISPQGV
jgi:hypothetical protein